MLFFWESGVAIFDDTSLTPRLGIIQVIFYARFAPRRTHVTEASWSSKGIVGRRVSCNAETEIGVTKPARIEYRLTPLSQDGPSSDEQGGRSSTKIKGDASLAPERRVLINTFVLLHNEELPVCWCTQQLYGVELQWMLKNRKGRRPRVLRYVTTFETCRFASRVWRFPQPQAGRRIREIRVCLGGNGRDWGVESSNH